MAKSEILKEAGFKEEVAEEVSNQFIETGFPKPLKRFRVIWEASNIGMEEPYFWILNMLNDFGYPNSSKYLIKTIDTFSSAENSAFFGVSQQRLGLQQDKVSQFLATIGKMVKEVFQLVRELRIIDERLNYYHGSLGLAKDGKTKLEGGRRDSDEITLKGIWVDMVEGGSKNPGSVFGMAQQIQFTSLPDLFFSTHPKESKEVDEFVENNRGEFNDAVKRILKRKLNMFLTWKETTFEELKTRKGFTLKYLRQHYTVIKMYMVWVKPYLKHVRRLTLDDDKVLSPQMVSAFEGSMVEVEVLATKPPKGQYRPCVLAHFLYRTRPSMAFHQEGYQRGPVHVGRVEINLRGYAWTEEEIKKYQEMSDKEDLELIRSISDTMAEAIDSMGGELKQYLEEAEGKEKDKTEEEKAKEEKPSFLDQLRSEFIGPPSKKKSKIKKPKLDPMIDKNNKKVVIKTVKGDMFNTYKNFKKAHGMVMW